MKKWLILFLVLVVAGGLFAQELKWSGGVMMGLGLSSSETAAPTIYDENWWWGDNDWGGGTWSKAAAQLEGNYSQDNTRVTLRLRGYFDNTNAYSIGVPLAKVEFDLLNKIIGIRAGRLDEGLWNTQVNDWWQVTNGVGALVEVKPIEGLSIGAILKTDGPSGGVKNAGELFQRTAFGFSYNKANLLYVSGAMQLADGARDAVTDDLNKAAFATYGLNINAVPNLILNTEGKFNNIGAEGVDISINLRQDLGYNIIPGTFKAVLRLFENLDPNTNNSISFRPYGEYVINSSFTAYLEVQGDMPLVDDGKIDLYIMPKLTYNIAPGASIIGYYRVDIKGAGGDPIHQVKFSFSSTF